ncbi:MAG: M16 family metallopeptidase [Candidatus Dormibacteria bacterium]
MLETEVTTLANGLRVVSTPMELRSMTCMLFVGAGSRYESRRLSGISHFLEHLFFKGTPRRPTANTIAAEVDALGAQFNAFTSKEYTGYWIRGASEILPDALDLLCDMLRNALVDPAEIEKERGVILEEAKLYEDTPQRRAHQLFDEIWYGSQAMGRPIIGEADVIRSLTRDDFMDYRDRLYAPERMLVCVAGGVDHARCVSLADGLLGDLPARPPVTPETLEPGPADPVGFVHKPILQSHFYLGMPGLATDDPRLPALEVACTILGGNMSSRLFERVREQEGLCYAIRAGCHDASDHGQVMVYAGTDPDKARRALELTLEEIALMANAPVQPDELARAKSYLRGMTVLAIEDSRSVVNHAAADLTLLGRVRSVDEELERLDRVSVEEVAAVAHDLLQPEFARLAVVGPFDDAGQFESLLPAVTVH